MVIYDKNHKQKPNTYLASTTSLTVPDGLSGPSADLVDGETFISSPKKTSLIRYSTPIAFPNLAAMGADVASLARVLKHSRLVELDPTGTLVRPRPRESAAS